MHTREFPDKDILKILSLLPTKVAVRTSALSRAWRYKWTKMTSLSFSSKDFSTFSEFSKFLTACFLALRANNAQVFSVNLTFEKLGDVDIIKQILDFAFSVSLKQLNITILSNENFEFDMSLLCSKSLTHLTLDGCQFSGTKPLWDLPALETLNLYNFTVRNPENVTIFFPWSHVLRNLTMKDCKLLCPMLFIDIRTRISSLTLEEGRDKPVTVLAPLLENLTIRNWRNIDLDILHRLSSLLYIDSRSCIESCGQDGFPLKLYPQFKHYMRMDICIVYPNEKEEEIRKLIFLLDQLVSVEALIINQELVEVLSRFMEDRPQPSPPLFHLKHAIVYPAIKPGKVEVHSRFVNYLLELSPLISEDLVIVNEPTIGMDDPKLVRILTRQWQVEIDCMKKEKKQPIKVSDWPSYFDLTTSWSRAINYALERNPSSHEAALLAKLETVRLEHYCLINKLD